MAVRKLDSFDQKILNRLAIDGRITLRKLAEHIHLSLTPTLRRVRRLESERYIAGYAAALDDSKVFGSISLLLIVNIDEERAEAFEEQISSLPGLISCSAMEAAGGYALLVQTEDLIEADKLLDKMADFAGLQELKSFPILKVVLQPSVIPTWP